MNTSKNKKILYLTRNKPIMVNNTFRQIENLALNLMKTFLSIKINYIHIIMDSWKKTDGKLNFLKIMWGPTYSNVYISTKN